MSPCDAAWKPSGRQSGAGRARRYGVAECLEAGDCPVDRGKKGGQGQNIPGEIAAEGGRDKVTETGKVIVLADHAGADIQSHQLRNLHPAIEARAFDH